jgi:mono/diheme cytochrome c family protein
MNHSFHPAILFALALLVLAAACSPQSAEPTSTPAATNTPYVFPTYAFNQPTEAPQVATAAAATAAARQTTEAQTGALDPVAVERGKGRWDALECASCHGENGVGTDDGPPLAGTTLTEREFVDFLRTGGTIGNDHLYSTNRLSTGGAANLYQYVLSLGTEAG